jgi:hypothetical protein
MKHISCTQYSPEWRKARLGIPTASSFAKVMMGKGTKTRQDYLCRLVMERILGRSLEEDVQTKWMRHGSDTEAVALAAFETAVELETEPVGFILHDSERYGCSPDRFVKDHATIIEIKCPAPWTHCRYHLFGPGDDYQAQVQGQLLITGYDYAYFYSYFPGLPSCMVETERDEKYIKKLETELNNFCDELDEKTKFFEKIGQIDQNEALYVLAKLMPEVCQ